MSIVGEIIDQALQAKKELGCHGGDCFYRGQHSGQALLPSLLRNNIEDRGENNLYCDSWVKAGEEIISFRNSWEILAHFQHYGIPTRLLDWTSSLINAIFFSITSCQSCKKEKGCAEKIKNESCDGNPCIWILDTAQMHIHFHGEKSKLKEYYAITIGIDEFPDYFSCFVKWPNQEWPFPGGPIFIEVPWISSRIKTQKGYFTFHPDSQDINDMEKSIRDTFSRRIDIPHIDVETLLEEIKVLGVTEFDIYPDLSALGSYLKKKVS